MIKDKYLEPFYKKNINLDIYIEKNIKVEDIISFLKKIIIFLLQMLQFIVSY